MCADQRWGPGCAVDDNDRKERFSLAYIGAVAAHAGYQAVEGRAIDKDSVDGHFESNEGQRPRIEFQAKSITQSEDLRRIMRPVPQAEDLLTAAS